MNNQIMNRRGGIMLSILFAVFFFVAGILLVNFLRGDITTFNTAMDCNNYSGISDGVKLSCLIGNGVIIYWIIAITAITGGIILDKIAP